jgi:hypothetical protein
MQLRRPRYTILSLMIVVLVAGVVLAIFVAFRERQRRRAQLQATISSALANYLNAQLTRQAAEITVVEYTEGILKADLETLDGEIALAKTDVTRTEERLAAAKRQRARDKTAESSLADSEKDARRANLRLQHAQEKRTALMTDTKERTLKDLNDEVEVAKANEAARKAEYNQAKASAMGWF